MDTVNVFRQQKFTSIADIHCRNYAQSDRLVNACKEKEGKQKAKTQN